jgi:Tol biopolymer transport system component
MRAVHRSSRRMLIVGAVIALVSLPAIGAGAVEDQPEIGFFSGENPVLSNPDPGDVYVANADGTGKVNLTAGYGAGRHWAWSPDGSRIAFFSDDGGVEKLYVRALDQAEPFVVAEGADPGDGWAWSPDSTRIAYVSLQDGDTDIYVASVGTLTSQNVSNDAWGSSGPSWSPTGDSVAYDVHREDSEGRYVDVYIAPASGGNAVNVTNDRSWSPGGSWSPDGSRFVFVTNRDGNDEIYVADGDGRNPVRLTNDPANDRDPAWSPDGSQIAFSSGLGEGGCLEWQISIPSRIYVMDADGSNGHAVTDGSIDSEGWEEDLEIAQTGPTWAPDGSRLAVVSTLDGCGPHQRLFTVYAVDPTTGGPPVELWSGGGGWWLRWSPDGTRMTIQSTGNYGIDTTTVIATADGSSPPIELVRGIGSGPEGWSTYGTHFAYSNEGGASGPGDTVFVTDPDGTNPVDITASLEGPVNTAATWRPQPLGPVGLVDPSTGLWYLRDEWGVIDSFYYGNPGDVPFLGDWDGDGIETPGLYRQSDGYVYLHNSNTQGIADIRFFFGNPGDVPLAGDFNGDGFDTVSIYRPSEQRFYIINELGANDGGLGVADYSFMFGNPGDQPVVGDWDGDGADEIGLHRASTGFFYYRNTPTTGIADGEFYFGNPGDRFVAGDWGIIDGRDTPAVFRPSNTVFYFRHTLTQGNADSQFTWPEANTNWIPVAGTYTN